MFKEYSSYSLKREQVVSELEKINNLGWEVFVNAYKDYIIKIDDTKEILIEEADGKWFITSNISGIPRYGIYASSVETFNNSIIEASNILETNLKIEKINQSIRIKSNEPFSNKVKILTLLGNSKVSRIFDPYFDLKSLITLIALKKLGAEFDTKMECITTKDLNIFDPTVIANFNIEGKTVLQIKKCEEKEHRRFIILNDNRIIIIGCSLNDIDKNEVVSEETQQEAKNNDLKFFNEQWVKS